MKVKYKGNVKEQILAKGGRVGKKFGGMDMSKKNQTYKK